MEIKPSYHANHKYLNPASPAKAKSTTRGPKLDGWNPASPAKEKSNTRGPNLDGCNILEEIFPFMGEDFSGMERKVMVVVDSTQEAKRALLWVLSHALCNDDKLILLHVAQLPPGNEYSIPSRSQISPKDSNALNSLKELCMQQSPGLDVEVMIVGGKDKGPTIVEQAKKRSVSLLVLGQPKASFMTKLRAILLEGKWTGRTQNSSAAVVEYCIQNSECTTLAVKKKGRKEGGYLISTKKHKNFWLLA